MKSFRAVRKLNLIRQKGLVTKACAHKERHPLLKRNWRLLARVALSLTITSTRSVILIDISSTGQRYRTNGFQRHSRYRFPSANWEKP
jgi:hypothetical protein